MNDFNSFHEIYDYKECMGQRSTKDLGTSEITIKDSANAQNYRNYQETPQSSTKRKNLDLLGSSEGTTRY